MAPCGLYCGVCGVYLATRNGDDKFKALLGGLVRVDPRGDGVPGLHAGRAAAVPVRLLPGLPIRDCVRERGLYSCHQCGDWPCALITGFPLATGRRVMRRTIPLWREQVARLGAGAGDVAWARAEGERYHCPECGEPLFRGAQRCRACKASVAEGLDGSL